MNIFAHCEFCDTTYKVREGTPLFEQGASFDNKSVVFQIDRYACKNCIQNMKTSIEDIKTMQNDWMCSPVRCLEDEELNKIIMKLFLQEKAKFKASLAVRQQLC